MRLSRVSSTLVRTWSALAFALAMTSPALAAGPKTIGTVTFVGRPGLEGLPIVGYTWASRLEFGVGGGAAVGKTAFDPFRVVKLVDATSPALLALSFGGNSVGQVRVDVTLRRGTTASYLLSDVVIVADERRAPASGGPPLQELAFQASAVRETLVTAGGTVTACFSLKENQPCN